MPASASSRSTSLSPKRATLSKSKPAKARAEILALAEDREPGQAGLEALEADLLEQPEVVGDRPAPFAVVIVADIRAGRRCQAQRLPAVCADDQPVILVAFLPLLACDNFASRSHQPIVSRVRLPKHSPFSARLLSERNGPKKLGQASTETAGFRSSRAGSPVGYGRASSRVDAMPRTRFSLPPSSSSLSSAAPRPPRA